MRKLYSEAPQLAAIAVVARFWPTLPQNPMLACLCLHLMPRLLFLIVPISNDIGVVVINCGPNTTMACCWMTKVGIQSRQRLSRYTLPSSSMAPSYWTDFVDMEAMRSSLRCKVWFTVRFASAAFRYDCQHCVVLASRPAASPACLCSVAVLWFLAIA